MSRDPRYLREEFDLPTVILHSTAFRIEEAETPELRQRRTDRRDRILRGYRELVSRSSRGRGPFQVSGSNHESIIMYEEHAEVVADSIRGMLGEI